MSADPYLSTEKCVERLFREWQKHPRLIVSADFDDSVYPFHGEDNTYERVLSLLRRCQKHQFYIVIFTASIPERYDMMIEYLRSHGIHVDSINKNPIDLPFGNWGKIYANIYLDDRGGLKQSVEILERTLDNIEEITKKQLTPAPAPVTIHI